MLEYSGLSTATGTAAVDQFATATGTTTTAGTVSSGATAAIGAGNELAVGFYSDSGFGDTLTAGSGWTARTNISNTSDMEILAEDQVVGAGATPSASAGTGAKTPWEMATVVFKSGTQAPPSVPAAPANVTATAGNQSAVVSWTAPANNGSPITSYTVTPYIGSAAQTALATTIAGNPPATSTTVTGLANGTAYTFTVTATNGVGTGPASAASAAVTPAAPTVPAAPTGVTATAGNASATVSWTAPANGGSPITSYTVTPYIGSAAQTALATTVAGNPPATSTTVTGLTNGTAYTFTVTATNGVGTGPASAASAAVTPTTLSAAFVQQVGTYVGSATSLSVAPAANLTAGNRLVVLAGIWGSGGPTASGVADSAGDTFTEVLHFKASDGTEMSVWTAPITAGGGTRPTIKVTSSAKGDIGIEALEYSGLSSAAGTGAIDQMATATGTTGSSSGTVTSAATPATTAANELILGFYVDSGFGDTLSPGTGYTQRANVSPNGNMEFLVEDATAPVGATPAASAGTGPKTVWLMSTVVFKL
jgi:hypothetical protein